MTEHYPLAVDNFEGHEPEFKPVLGYAGTSGHSGGATSEERVRRDDTDGTTGKRQRRVLTMLGRAAEEGMTVKGVARATGWHHGQASAALSNLHKAGLICRTTERRDRCFVYVLPEYLGGRDTQPHGGTKRSVLTDVEEQQVEAARVCLAAYPDNSFNWAVSDLLAIIDRIAP